LKWKEMFTGWARNVMNVEERCDGMEEGCWENGS
jgi:hypothetical protein